VGHEPGQVLGISCLRLLTGSGTQQLDEAQESPWIVLRDFAIGTGVVAIGAERLFWEDDCSIELLAPAKETELAEVTRGPGGQLPKALELTAVIGLTPAGRVGWFCRRLKFNERSRGSARSNQGNIRSPNARSAVLWYYGEPRHARKQREHSV